MRMGVVLGLAVALVACQQSDTAVSATPAASSGTVAAATVSPPAAKARQEKVETDLIDFDYGYPAKAAAIPDLKRWLDADIDRQKADLTRQAIAARREARQGGWEFHALGYWVEWQVVTDLPGWLSLSASVGTYEGGAHPNHNFATILWDRHADRRREPVSLFTSPKALTAAIQKDFCRELDVQRKERRGADYMPESPIPEFDGCIDPVTSGVVILGSSNRRTFDRLGVLVPPYSAGPYVEGSYEVTLPVTAQVLAAVKPAFRESFSVKR